MAIQIIKTLKTNDRLFGCTQYFPEHLWELIPGAFIYIVKQKSHYEYKCKNPKHYIINIYWGMIKSLRPSDAYMRH